MEISKQSKILILGNSGKIGSQIESQLRDLGYTNIQGSHDQDGNRKGNLLNLTECGRLITDAYPDYLIVCAGVDSCFEHGFPKYKPLLYNYNIIINVLMSIMHRGDPLHLYYVDAGLFRNEAMSDLLAECSNDPKNKSKYHYINNPSSLIKILNGDTN